ncbi:MAG TPA: acyl carrier protein [Micropepsaceae bacterium]|nr:acyl carrier protein [Micropepsaceae bacterium]
MSVQTELEGIIKKHAAGKADGLNADTMLAEIGLDSIDMAEIVFEIEDKFRIQLPQNNEQMASATFADLIGLVEGLIAGKPSVASPQAT